MSTPILSCTNLTKSYTAGKPVLHNLNISLSGGKIVGLLLHSLPPTVKYPRRSLTSGQKP